MVDDQQIQILVVEGCLSHAAGGLADVLRGTGVNLPFFVDPAFASGDLAGADSFTLDRLAHGVDRRKREVSKVGFFDLLLGASIDVPHRSAHKFGSNLLVDQDHGVAGFLVDSGGDDPSLKVAAGQILELWRTSFLDLKGFDLSLAKGLVPAGKEPHLVEIAKDEPLVAHFEPAELQRVDGAFHRGLHGNHHLLPGLDFPDGGIGCGLRFDRE